MIGALAGLTLALPAGAAPPAFATAAQVAAVVKAAPTITSIPATLTPTLANAVNDTAYQPQCMLSDAAVTEGTCLFGATTAKRSMVLVGDSDAAMWFGAMNTIAQEKGWRLYFFEKSGCPIPDTSFWNSNLNVAYPECSLWHASVITRIKKLDPDLIVLSSSDYLQHDGNDLLMTNKEWEAGMEKSLRLMSAPNTQEAILGDIPYLTQSAPTCLAANPTSVQSCSSPRRVAAPASAAVADITAAEARHVLYVDVLPWICSATCSPIIGSALVYEDRFHITQTYAEYLTGVLATALAPVMTAK